jgi:16S rRNA (guanine527-N7)-methyltransferase
MAFTFPLLSFDQFCERLRRSSGVDLVPEARLGLHAHYMELGRWNARLNLIGPGTASEIVERHYAEALRALPLLPEGPGTLVDLGSGAGFPGIVLAAVRGDLRTTLVEAKERKWAFLEAAARRAELPCRCLNVRVRVPLPDGLPERIDAVTTRALRLDSTLLAAFAERLSPDGVILLWTAEKRPDLPPELLIGEAVSLGAGTSRQILQLRPKSRRDVTAR